MTSSRSAAVPRWVTAVIMFAISFSLVFLTYFSDIVNNLYYFITILVALLLWLYIDKQPPNELGFKYESKWWLQLILGVMGSGLIIGFLIWLEILLGWIIPSPLFLTQPWWVITGTLTTYALWQGLVAVGEELVARGYIQQNLTTRLSAKLAILSASIMFALQHIPKILWYALPLENEIIIFINMFLGGIMLGLAFAKSGALWLPIGLHFGFNFMIYHIAGYGGNGIYQLQNIGLPILTGGVVGPEAGLTGTVAFIFLIALVWLWTRGSNGTLMKRFERQSLFLFAFGFLVAVLPAAIGLWIAELGLFLVVWLVYMIIFLQIWENRILCRHCPYYAMKGRTLRCHANYGLVKLWKYNPAPMSRSEQIQMIIGVMIFIGFPFPFLLLGQQWLLLVITSFGTIIFASMLFAVLCPRCVNFSCPFNRVPKDVADIYLKETPLMREAWKSKEYSSGLKS